jgi:hypothetical protein
MRWRLVPKAQDGRHEAVLAADTIEATQLAGPFAAVRCKAGKLEAFGDPLGLFPLRR